MVSLALEPVDSALPVAEKYPRWWTRRRLLCFELVDKGLDNSAVAAACQRSYDWVKQTKAHPAFKAKLAAVLADIEASITTYGYGNKSRRLKRLHDTAVEVGMWREEHGLSERTVRYDKDGNELGETVRFNKDVVAEERQVLHAIAEELGQLPRTGDNATGSIVLIRELNISIESIG